MVTGSHIPEDRNGIKFNRPDGEILKEDEARILAWYERLQDDEAPAEVLGECPVETEARRDYVDRYLNAFPQQCLSGLRIGVYQHSSVARELQVEILRTLGAEVIPFGWSDRFVAVDTEAVENLAELQAWVEGERLDALVSADGDADRPLLIDETGRQVRGDVLGTLAARCLRADAVATPISSNTVVERCRCFTRVVRTRIGSPYVIVALNQLAAAGFSRVVGFEANGGFLTKTRLYPFSECSPLEPLPTRDAMLPLVTVLVDARRRGISLTGLQHELPARFTWSGLLRRFPQELGAGIVAALRERGEERIEELLGSAFGSVKSVDWTDGARIMFDSGEIVHFRPSGNAPEFRCYAEADSEERAQELVRQGLELVRNRLRSWFEEGGK
jgi:phosphomannomutase